MSDLENIMCGAPVPAGSVRAGQMVATIPSVASGRTTITRGRVTDVEPFTIHEDHTGRDVPFVELHMGPRLSITMSALNLVNVIQGV